MILKEKYVVLIECILQKINEEFQRLYWNENQQHTDGPVYNIGMNYANKTFVIRSYDWNGNFLPNFQYKNLRVWWYKHLGRGTYAKSNTEPDVDFLYEMLKDCIYSLRVDFGEENNDGLDC